MQIRRKLFGALFVGILFVPVAFAQTLSITPAIVDSSEPVERALKENQGRAMTTLEGKGKTLKLTYSASEPLEIFMVPLYGENSYVPTDYFRFTLPMTDQGTAAIDLTVTPGWTPGHNRYLVNMFSKTESADASFISAEFEPASIIDTAVIAVKHLFTVEPYTPSSYHALRGYRVFGMPFTPALGVIALLVTAIVFVTQKPERKIPAAIFTLLLFILLYGARFSVDLLRFTKQHVPEYGAGQYDEAGSIYQVAEQLRSIGTKDDTVFVCRDGTDFKEKLLRYFTYPVRVVSRQEFATGATLAVVMDKLEWSYGESQLKCGPIGRNAEKLSEFSDGSVLFRLKE